MKSHASRSNTKMCFSAATHAKCHLWAQSSEFCVVYDITMATMVDVKYR